MEEPFRLNARKHRLLFAFLAALWLSVGVASAMYVADAPAVADVAD
jgi:hypothetical protein